jgi:hypothetical protein
MAYGANGGLVVDLGMGEESFMGGGMMSDLPTPVKAFLGGVIGLVIIGLVLLLCIWVGEVTTLRKKIGLGVDCGCTVDANGDVVPGEFFGNRVQPTFQPTGATPSGRYQEFSAANMGGSVFNERTRMSEATQNSNSGGYNAGLEAAIQGGRSESYANSPLFHTPSNSRWQRNDRQTKGMRMFASLKQSALNRGEEWNQSFDDWYKSWKGLPENRLNTDVYYGEGLKIAPMDDRELMKRSR